MISFAERLQYLIESKKYKQNQFAELSGFNVIQVNKWLAGNTRKPQKKTLRKICDFFGCDYDWLSTGKGQPFPSTNNKVKATIEPGNNRQRSRIADQAKRPTQTDPCLIEIVQWMDEYFGEFPHQTPAFSRDMADRWESFQRFLEKKREGGNLVTQPRPKVSNSD